MSDDPAYYGRPEVAECDRLIAEYARALRPLRQAHAHNEDRTPHVTRVEAIIAEIRALRERVGREPRPREHEVIAQRCRDTLLDWDRQRRHLGLA